MRTNIELDDDLLSEARKYSEARSKRGIVREAMAMYVAVKKQEARTRGYRERLQEIRKQTAGMRLRSDTRDLVREDRDKR